MVTKSFRCGEKGFTLIEMAVVIAVLGVLAAVVVPSVASFLVSGAISGANTEVQNVKTACKSFLADVAVFPPNSDNLTNGATQYMSAAPKAKYTFDINGVITRVDIGTLKGSWSGIVFNVAPTKQAWQKGTDDSTAPGSQDINSP